MFQLDIVLVVQLLTNPADVLVDFYSTTPSIPIDILSINSSVAEHFGSERFDRNLMVVFDQNSHLFNKIPAILGQPRSTRYMLQRHSLI